jgi:hypothetical protein
VLSGEFLDVRIFVKEGGDDDIFFLLLEEKENGNSTRQMGETFFIWFVMY